MTLSFRIFIALMISVLCISCDPNLNDQQNNLEFIIEGSQSNNVIKRNSIIDNQADYESAYFSDKGNPTPAPKIDFEQRLLVAIFLGQQSTGGYAITIANIVELDNQTHILLSISAPGPGCQVSQEITTPYSIYSIPTTEKDIVFIENHTTSACI